MAKQWIAGAIKHPGALRKTMGVKAGEKIPENKLEAVAEQKGVTGQRARLAMTLKKMHK
jgi:ribosomal protein L12E/L44/L45/RPP1/RPP2